VQAVPSDWQQALPVAPSPRLISHCRPSQQVWVWLGTQVSAKRRQRTFPDPDPPFRLRFFRRFFLRFASASSPPALMASSAVANAPMLARRVMGDASDFAR
jgi:hypothetical protein